MRIKFRAYDKLNDEIVKVGAIAWDSNVFNTKNYTFGSQPHFYDTNGCLHLIEECILMQYTGLKDIKGKEICEGDIITFKFDGETKISKVKADVLNGTTVSFKSFGNDYNFNLSRIYSEDRNIEVIGNIYEDQELLD